LVAGEESEMLEQRKETSLIGEFLIDFGGAVTVSLFFAALYRLRGQGLPPVLPAAFLTYGVGNFLTHSALRLSRLARTAAKKLALASRKLVRPA
jgi:hypothetical protein